MCVCVCGISARARLCSLRHILSAHTHVGTHTASSCPRCRALRPCFLRATRHSSTRTARSRTALSAALRPTALAAKVRTGGPLLTAVVRLIAGRAQSRVLPVACFRLPVARSEPAGRPLVRVLVRVMSLPPPLVRDPLPSRRNPRCPIWLSIEAQNASLSGIGDRAIDAATESSYAHQSHPCITFLLPVPV